MKFLSISLGSSRKMGFHRLAAVAFLSLLVSGLLVRGWFTRWDFRTPVLRNGAGLRAEDGGLSLSFEANQGQADSRIRFLARGRGYSILLSDSEALLKLPGPSQAHADEKLPWIRMRHVGANPEVRVKGSDLTRAKSHYFLGNDPKAWKTNVPNYAKVGYEGIYPGVDLVYYGKQGQLEYDYVLATGVDPDVITLGFQGVDRLSIDAAGDLLIASGSGELCLMKPRAYQWSQGSARPVQSAYRIKGEQQIGFELGAFNPSLPVVIDPVLTYSTYLGGSEDDRGLGIAVDADGNTYVAGVTQSANFPHSGNSSGAGGEDLFVSKFNPSGSALIYSAYLGGSAADVGKGLAVDAAGNVYVSGGTRSNNFPVSPGAFQTTLRGGSDAFVLKMNPAGNQLMYSTYLGGTGEEGFEGGGLALDATGQAYVTGVTNSLDFPTSRVTFQRSFGGGSSDAFVSKLRPDGTGLVYSTYLGGFDLDEGRGIAVDSAGRAYVTGRTRSPNFVLHDAFQPFRYSALDDAFVTKLNAVGDLVTYSTFLGGSGNDAGDAIAVDGSGNAYVAGETDSSDFPATAAAFMKAQGGALDGFVVKLQTTAAQSASLIYATYLGGTGNDVIRGIAAGSSGAVYVTGVTESTDFPTQNSAQAQFAGGASDAFAAKLDSLGRRLIYSTYLGGAGSDSGEAIALYPGAVDRVGAVDLTGTAFVAGITESNNFPTVAPLQPQAAGKKDVFVSRIPAGDGSPAAPTVTAGIVLDPSTSPYQVAQKLTAQFIVTNRGGSPAVLKTLTLVESDTTNAIPNFLPVHNLMIEPGDSFNFQRPLTLTQTGTFHFQVAYETVDGVWHDVPAEAGTSSQVDITVENSGNTAAPINSISASPNPCTVSFGQDSCTTSLTWTTVNTEVAEVWVEDIGIGAPQTRVASALSGAVSIDWIQGPPHNYKFTLYDVGSGTPRELSSAGVTGLEGNPVARGTLQISSNPCEIPAGSTTCTTSITWTTIDAVTNAILYVQDIGAGNPPSGIQAGKSGTVEVNWIQGPPHRYIFSLFEITATGQVPIASIEVLGKEQSNPAAPSGTISTSPVSCVDGATCSTLVSWNVTNNFFDSRVVVTDVGASGVPTFLAKGKSGSLGFGAIEASPHRYVFTLYGLISNLSVQLASVEVSGTQSTSRRGTLTASSNPCEIPEGGENCATTLTWTSVDAVANAILYVEDVGLGHPPSGISVGKSGSVEIPWIQPPPHRYIFTLFETTGTSQVAIASLEVTGKRAGQPSSPSGTIWVAPSSCGIPQDGTTCSTVVSWSTTSDVIDAKVVVTDVGANGTPAVLTNGKSGSATYGTVEASPHRYVFTLYGFISNSLVELGSVEVTGTKFTGRGLLQVSSNPCEIPTGATACSTTIYWTTLNEVASAVLYVQDIGAGNPPSGVAAGKSGTVEIGWIQALPHRYVFTLFEITAGGQVPIASIEVTGKVSSNLAAFQARASFLSDGITARRSSIGIR